MIPVFRSFSLSLASLLLPLLTLSATAAADLTPSQACTQIDQAYSACGRRFQYTSPLFHFPVGREKVPMQCSDDRNLSFYDRLEDMDVASMLMIPYQHGTVAVPEMRKNWDPGRLRAEPLLKSVYGFNEGSVRQNLVPVKFLNQTILFQQKLGAAAALNRVGQDLVELAKTDAGAAKFLAPFLEKKKDIRLGGFIWRFVKGTTRLSTHSYGTAIDLVGDQGSQYWLWDEMARTKNKNLSETEYKHVHYVSQGKILMPQSIVDAFETHGFIWGGKWNHYDTMHFEYRPEFHPGLEVDCVFNPLKHASLDSDFDLLEYLSAVDVLNRAQPQHADH